MDSERLVRHTFAGIVFIFYMLVFFFMFDGQLDLTVLSKLNSEAFYLPIASLLLTTPVIGLIISTLSVTFQLACDGYRTHYATLSRLLIDRALRDYPEFRARYNENVNNLEGKDVRRMYYHYMVVRQKIKGDSLKFLERRWNIYWVHSNNLIALVLAYIIAMITRMVQFYVKPEIGYWKPPVYVIIIILIVTVIYIAVAFIQIFIVRREATIIEQLILDDKFRVRN